MADASAQLTATRSVRRRVVVIAALAVALGTVGAWRMTIGEAPPLLPDGSVDVQLHDQFLAIRGARVRLAVIVGAALSVAGAVLQSLLRNPLASPYILGVSTGAALGVMVSWTGYFAVLGVIGTSGAALAGALATMGVVYALAQRRGRVDPIGLLLIGVILNSINAAAIMLVGYLDPGTQGDLMRWMMGYLDEGVADATIYTVGAVTLIGVAVAAWWGPAMDVATFSDSEARALGVRLGRLRLGLFALAGVLTAASVMLAGPVGFIGLICPHLARILLGPANRWVVIGAALAGGVVVVLADIATKLIDTGAAVGTMPIGVLTALIGGPVFIVLLRPQLGRGDA